jgi:hypothetical protein
MVPKLHWRAPPGLSVQAPLGACVIWRLTSVSGSESSSVAASASDGPLLPTFSVIVTCWPGAAGLGVRDWVT